MLITVNCYIYPYTDENRTMTFECPEEWLKEQVINDGYASLEEFFEMYTLYDGTRYLQKYQSYNMTQATEEKLYKLYDVLDDDEDGERDYEVETLESMKKWLANHWENNPNEDQSEEDIEELKNEIMNSDESELFNRLEGIGYSFCDIDEDISEIEKGIELPNSL